MNERSNRNYRARRHIGQASSSNHYHNNRSIYHHGHPADSYSTSNYRHPSTTTTTTTSTEPSISLTDQSSNDCAISMCYSYLIAIFSSFLVVLGIYLSLTRFNVHYLYISLLGLSTVAIGACTYCIGNIRSSQLAKRKQRVNYTPELISDNSQSNIGRINDNPTRQQQITTRALSNNHTSNLALESSQVATNLNVVNENNGTLSDQQLSTLSEPQANSLNERATISNTVQNDNLDLRNENAIIVISPQINQQADQVDSDDRAGSTHETSQLERLSISSRSPQSPETVSEDFLSSTGLLENQVSLSEQRHSEPSHDRATGNGDKSNALYQPVAHASSQLDSSPSDINNLEKNGPSCSMTENASPSGENPQSANDNESAPSANLVDVTFEDTSIDQDAPSQGTSAEPSTDLINLQHQPKSNCGLLMTGNEEHQVTRRRAQNHERNANLRRTLVMGLSGEEEMIEIDEDDLDNMSIPPPSYDSVAASSRQRGA